MVRGLFVVVLGCLAAASQGQICIDPGHPSEVGRGTHGKLISEIRLVWQVANKLKTALERGGYSVLLTKQSENQFVRNRQRAEIANKFQAKLMLRLHCDAQGGTGFAVYAPDRQGVSAGAKGPSRGVIDASWRLGRVFHQELAKRLNGKLKDNGLKPDTKTAVGAKQGALTGSVFSKVPVVLVEMCVLTNPKDERYVTSAKGQMELVDALKKAVEATCDASPLRLKVEQGRGTWNVSRP